MAKDPAVLFYTSDFLSGTFTMTNEQVGKYMRLLCLQHQKGALTEKDMINVCGTYDEDVFLKFDKIGTTYVNKRMQIEGDKRKNFCESRRKARQHPNNQKTKKKTYVKRMENENENENRDENINTNESEIINPFGKNFTFWQGWKDYKKEEHRESYKSPKTEQAALNNLYKLSGGDAETAKLIINESISNRWKGLFELKNNTHGKQKGFSRSGVQEALNRRFAEMEQTGGEPGNS